METFHTPKYVWSDIHEDFCIWEPDVEEISASMNPVELAAYDRDGCVPVPQAMYVSTDAGMQTMDRR